MTTDDSQDGSGDELGFSDWAYLKLSGKSTFRNGSFSTIEKAFAIILYPLAIAEVVISPVVYLVLATVFHFWTPYFTHITAIIVYGSSLALVAYGVYLLL